MCPLGCKEIDGLLVLPGKVSTLLTDHTYSHWFSWVFIFEALFGCHDILILGKTPIKWRQRPDITIDLDLKHQFKQKKTFFRDFRSISDLHCFCRSTFTLDILSLLKF